MARQKEEKRLKGLRFNCYPMKQVYDGLFLGDLNDADNANSYEDHDVENILNVASPTAESTPSDEIVDEYNYINVPLLDGGSNPDFLIQFVLETAKELHEEGPTLIYCSVGVSRSVAVAAAVMSLENGKRVRENINRIRKVHPAVNVEPELAEQVSRITSELY